MTRNLVALSCHSGGLWKVPPPRDALPQWQAVETEDPQELSFGGQFCGEGEAVSLFANNIH